MTPDHLIRRDGIAAQRGPVAPDHSPSISSPRPFDEAPQSSGGVASELCVLAVRDTSEL
jgi:hypothetical protein